MILELLSTWFAQWAAEVGSLSWLAVALVAAIIEVSLPHFGCAFISAGAVAAKPFPNASYHGSVTGSSIGLPKCIFRPTRATFGS